jgi:hypothetical protein
VTTHMLRASEIRSALRRLLAQHWAACADTEFIEELGVCRGQVRIDLAVVNGRFHGFEVKSDRDNLARLPLQVDFYSRVVDRATLVVGPRYLNHAVAMVPPWWGVSVVVGGTSGTAFEIVRDCADNPRIDPRALVELLWRDDALALLDSRGAARGARGKPRAAVWDKVCEHFDTREIAVAVRQHLKLRARTLAPH